MQNNGIFRAASEVAFAIGTSGFLVSYNPATSLSVAPRDTFYTTLASAIPVSVVQDCVYRAHHKEVPG